MRLLYLSHPEVVIDPAVPVPDWGLAPAGIDRLRAAIAAGWPGPVRIACSDERKARETAEMIAQGRPVTVHPGLGEIDRSATGFVPPARHEELRLRLFGAPDTSAEGWETARAAQARAMAALADVLPGEGDLLVVGHGGVGTLTWCALTGTPIAAHHDQPRIGSVWQAEGPPFSPAPWQVLEAAVAGFLQAGSGAAIPPETR